MKAKNKIWRSLRIIAASLFFAAECIAFLGGALAAKGFMCPQLDGASAAKGFICPQLDGASAQGFMRLQLGSAVLSCAASFSAMALAVIAINLLIAYLFGRFYCSVFCPLGIFQDIIGFISRKKGVPSKSFIKVRLAIFGFSFGMVFAGWTLPFMLLEPYSNFGRIFGLFSVKTFAAGQLIFLAFITALSFFKKRFYCTTICPVGTLLSLAASKSVFKLEITDKCVRCKTCVNLCPSGCINLQARSIDNSRCVRCMNCLSACPLGAISFSAGGKKELGFNQSRRDLLITGAVGAISLAAGFAVSKGASGKAIDYAQKTFKILPPGAFDIKAFALKCTSCQLCTANCPEKIIVCAKSGYGPVSLKLSQGFCRFECSICSTVCPTGALTPIGLKEKQRLKIAKAVFNAKNCLVFQKGLKCGRCASACPVGAVALRKTGAPRPVNQNLCIGCGHCAAVCPAQPKAITIEPIEKQVFLRQT